MNFLEFFDRIGQRRLERWRIRPPRPWDTRQLVGVLFFAGYYLMVWSLRKGAPLTGDNAALVKDAMLVLGPVVGVIAQAIFRSDARDELATQNTGEFARAQTKQAEATIAAVNAPSPEPTAAAARAADKVADAAVETANEIKADVPTVSAQPEGPGNVPDA